MKQALKCQEPKQRKAFSNNYRAAVLAVLALLLSSVAFTQLDSAKYSNINGHGFRYKRTVHDSLLLIPLSTSPHTPYRKGAIRYRATDSTLQLYTGNQWISILTGVGNGVDTAYAVNDSTLVIETPDEDFFVKIVGRYWDFQGILNNGSTLTENETITILDSLSILSGLLIVDSLKLKSTLTVTDTTTHKPLVYNTSTKKAYLFDRWPGGGTPELTLQDNNTIKFPSNSAVWDAVALYEYPHLQCTGAGSEASPYTHADNTAYIQTILDTFKVARLLNKRYNIKAPITIRNTNGQIKTAEILGSAGFIMYPNAEGTPVTGTRLRCDSTGFRLGTLDFVNQPRPGRIRLRDFSMWGAGKDTLTPFASFKGAAIIVDGSADQPQFESLSITNFPFGFVGTGIWDEGFVRNVNIIGNRYPIWLDGAMKSGLYIAFEHCTIFDNQGPIVIGGGVGDSTVGVRISNCTIGSNGYTDLDDLGNGVIPNSNIVLFANNSIISNNYITNGGYSNLLATRITADGIVIYGDNNQINGNVIAGHNQSGACGIRVKSGATGTVINSKFRISNALYPNNATDVIIETGAINTTLFVYPGMTYTDNGTGTVIIDGSDTDLWTESSGNIYRNSRVAVGTTSFADGKFSVKATAADGVDPAYLEGDAVSAQFILKQVQSRTWAFGVGATGHPFGAGNFGVYDITAGATRLLVNSSGTTTIGSLAGSGTRMVTADASGNLGTQTIPAGNIASINSMTGPAITFNGGVGTYVTTGSNTLAYNVDPTSDIFPRTIDAIITTASNVGTGETDLYTKTIAAGTLNADKQTLNFEIDGEFNDNTATAQLKLYFAGNVTLNTGAVNISTAATAWKLKGYIIRTSSSTAHVTYELHSPGLATTYFLGYSNLTSLDFTGTNIFKVTAQAGGAGGGNGDITSHSWQILYKPQP